MINAKDVRAAITESLYEATEIDTDGKSIKAGLIAPIMVTGIKNNFAFHPDRLENTRERVTNWCNELEDEFFTGKGGGSSFLNICVTKNGSVWGEHSDCEALMCLAIGLGIMNYCIGKEFWQGLPGGMPYLKINLNNSHEQIPKGNDNEGSKQPGE